MRRKFAYSARHLFKARLRFRRLLSEEERMLNWILAFVLPFLIPQTDPETRVIEYLRATIVPGRPVAVQDVFNRTFKSAEEQQVVQRLFNALFQVPMAAVHWYTRTNTIPTLQQLSNQLRLNNPGELDLLLRIMESDSRIPRFCKRDLQSGEITNIDLDAITHDPVFGPIPELVIGGWEGKPAPPFAIHSLSGEAVNSEQLAGHPHLIYFWFTNCPPCVETAPFLVRLYKKYKSVGFEIIAVNADRVLALPYSDADRKRYLKKAGIPFAVGHGTPEMLQAYGSVRIFPSLFFVNRQGKIVKQLLSYQNETRLEDAVKAALEP
jgi:thiol-disulfide isomerase/thioredoxin